MDEIEYRRRFLDYILKKHPEGLTSQGWSPEQLSLNITLPFPYTLEYSGLNWNWDQICARNDTPSWIIEWIIVNHYEAANWYLINKHSSLSDDEFLKWLVTNYTNKINWDTLLQNDSISLDSLEWLIINHTDKIIWYLILGRRDLTFEFIKWIVLNYSELLSNGAWYAMSQHRSLTVDLIEWLVENYTDKVKWELICQHPSLDDESYVWLVKNYSDKVSWPLICIHIPADLIMWLVQSYTDRINWNMLCRNDSLTLDILQWLFINYVDRINWNELASNHSLTLEVVQWMMVNSPIDLLPRLYENTYLPLHIIIWLGDNYGIDGNSLRYMNDRRNLTVEFLEWFFIKIDENDVDDVLTAVCKNVVLSMEVIQWLVSTFTDRINLRLLIGAYTNRRELTEWLILEYGWLLNGSYNILKLESISIEAINELLILGTVNDSIWKNPLLSIPSMMTIITDIYRGMIRDRENLFHYANMSDDMLAWLFENYPYSMNMKPLSLNNSVDYRFILNNPGLGWDVNGLSRRTYIGYIHHMKTKSARRVNEDDDY